MQSWVLCDQFGLEHLRVVERDIPEPGPKEVLVRMHAVSLNYRDLMMVRGQYNPKQPLPLVPCSDGAGEVVGIGAEVSGLAQGDRVLPCFSQSWLEGEIPSDAWQTTLGGPLDGTLRQYALFSAQSLVKVPTHMTMLQAACLPCAGVTAWNALQIKSKITAQDFVLVQGSGGVSLFALQIAKAVGARVVALTSSESKEQRLRSLGADQVINYRQQPRWGKSIREWTGGLGVDHVVEVGGAGTLEQSLVAVRPGGTISLIGVLGGTQSSLNLLPILMRSVKVQGIFVGSRTALADFAQFCAEKNLEPVCDQCFPFDGSDQAFRRLESGQHFGKITISVG